MVRIGLTGGIASGKSTVADDLARRGAVIIDSDLLAREVVEAGTPALAAIVDRFGVGVLAGDRLDRAALGEVVFADPEARRDLEAIVHPAVRQRAAELEAAAPDGAVVVHVIPLLVETGRAGDFDLVVVVDVDLETQRRRLHRRDGLTGAQIDARLAAQATREQRLVVADVVLDNSDGWVRLRQQVDRFWGETGPATPSA